MIARFCFQLIKSPITLCFGYDNAVSQQAHAGDDRVSAHYVTVKGQAKPKTTILMKFEAAVLQRESRLPNV